MKEKILVLSSIALLLAGLVVIAIPAPSTSIIQASWVTKYISLASLVEDSDLIVMGDVMGSKVYRIGEDDEGVIFTDYTINVKKALLGDDAIKSITVTQTGGTMDELTTYIKDDPLLEENVDMVLFLKAWEGKYFIVGGPQGRFNVVSGKVYSIGELVKEASATTDGVWVGGEPLASFTEKLK